MAQYTKQMFNDYIDNHPEVYRIFERRALVAFDENPNGASQWQIVSDMRRYDRAKLPHGLSNGAIAHLARRFLAWHPDKKSLFTVRPLKKVAT